LTTYRDAGVDFERSERIVDYIKKKVSQTFGDYGGIGAFAGGIRLKGYQNPLIFTSADGVGTKLKIAQAMDCHKTVGIDLVAMNVNDVITTGAKPMLFLDYIATGKIDERVIKEIIDGIVEGCSEANTILAGGETAEMPGFYPEGSYDLAGFCVGICEEDKVIDPKGIKPGDVLIGLRSSGFHSNGFSLIRKVLKDRGISLESRMEETGEEVGKVLLKPTRIYVKEVLKVAEKVKGIAHITGGGIPGNLVRILPQNTSAEVKLATEVIPPEMRWLQRMGNIPAEEMIKTFNMGVGMILVVSPELEEEVLELLEGEGIRIGSIIEGKGEVKVRGTFQS
jgi:phosphoribosylformylglycinamidine cyclo-ligase